jgi:hypothetical protein
LDSIFAIVIVAIVITFSYFREKRLLAQFADRLARSHEVATANRPTLVEMRRPVIPAEVETVTQTTSAPIRVDRADAQAKSPKPARRATGSKAGRAEKYLEAVRMYRQGSDKGTIEKALGISFMELELLGQLKG